QGGPCVAGGGGGAWRRQPGSDAEHFAISGVAGGAYAVQAEISVEPLRIGASIRIEGRQHAATGAQQLVGMPDDRAVGPGLVGEAQQRCEGLIDPRDTIAPDQGRVGRGRASADAAVTMNEEPPGGSGERALD